MAPMARQQPHDCEIRKIRKGREIVRVRKDSASRANQRSDSGCQSDAGCSRFLFHDKPEQRLIPTLSMVRVILPVPILLAAELQTLSRPRN